MPSLNGNGQLLVALLAMVFYLLVALCIFMILCFMKKCKNYSLQVRQEVDTKTKDLFQINNALTATYRLFEIVLETTDFSEMAQKIANIIPQNLGFETGVLAIIDDDRKVLKRISISETTGGLAALKSLEVPFRKIEIPLDYNKNITIQAIKQNKTMTTTRLYNILRPVLSEKNSDLVQHTMGTKFSIISPISARGKITGVFIVSMSKTKDQLSKYEKEMITRFSAGVGIALDNARLLSQVKDKSLKLEHANKELKEADELKDEFVYVASHELRTPMTAIKNYLWLALNKQSKDMDEHLKKNLKRAYISTERLIKLVQDMLTVSRIEGKRLVLNFEKFDLTALYEQIVDELKVTADKERVKLTLVPVQQPIIIEGDKIRISEVIQNLIGNAIKFTPANGSITISFQISGGFVITSVSDTGFGIPKEDIPRLFKKFGRLGHSYKKVAESAGTGLGLFISKQIIEAHKGTISVQSEVDKGSTFIYTLPVVG